MLGKNIEFSVLIKGKEITEYAHDSKIFVEGRDGSEFTLKIRNNNHFRIEAVVSVDGLSIVDGKDAGTDSTGYVVGAYSTLEIPGWLVDSASAAKFEFAGKGNSYAEASTGSSRNTGVIGLMAFREKIDYDYKSMLISNNAIPMNGYPYPGSTGDYESNHYRGISKCANTFSTMNVSASSLDTMASACCDSVSVEQSLGTAFGEATDFKTQKIDFKRGEMVILATIFYDSKDGLIKRGIVVRNPKAKSEPNAFPGMYCAPPKGWRG